MLVLAAIAVFGAGDLFAGSIDYLSNQSADYARTFSRNASTDSDAVLYNPAGTAFMSNGIHLYFSNQTILKKYEDDQHAGIPTYDKTYESTKATPFLPTLTATYKTDKWAAFIAGNAVAGGGSAVYNKGVPTFNLYYFSIYSKSTALASQLGTYTGKGKLEATSFYPACTIGGSYSITDIISVSLAGRYVYGYKSYKGNATYATAGKLELDAKETAQGFGAIIGFDIKPVNGLLVSAKYETATKLNFKTKINDGKDLSWTYMTGPTTTATRHDFFIDGEKRRKDLPALLALGTSYTFGGFTATGSFTYYFIKQSDQDKDNGTLYSDGYDDDYDNGYECSLSLEYAVIPDFLRVSLGGMHTKVGGNKDTYNDFDFSLDSNSIGCGAKITAMKDFDITIGVAHTFYKSTERADGNVTYKKAATIFAIGAEYKI